jgi:hypothetical protein
MKKHPVISFLASLIASGLILGLLFILFLFLTFNLAGGETLQEMEKLRFTELLIAIFIMVLTATIVKEFIKKGRKYSAAGISVLPVVAFAAISYYYIDNFSFHATFNKTVWQQSERKPFDMAATLVKQNKLISLSKKEVTEMLGQGHEELDENLERSSISYFVEKGWTLTVYFENSKAVDVQMRLPMMMTERTGSKQQTILANPEDLSRFA